MLSAIFQKFCKNSLENNDCISSKINQLIYVQGILSDILSENLPLIPPENTQEIPSCNFSKFRNFFSGCLFGNYS